MWALPLLILLAAGAASWASSSPTDVHEPACLRVCESEITTIGQRECLSREREAAQRRLDAEIAAVEARYAGDAEILAAFKGTQSAWSAFYTSDCRAVGLTWAGGSGRRSAEEFCRLDHVRRRALDLWLVYHLESMPEPPLICSDLRP